MISSDSVIALDAGFVTANKVRLNELAKGFESSSRIETVAGTKSDVLTLVSTKHFDILVTCGQLICRFEGDETGIKASDLLSGSTVYTSNGIEIVTDAVTITEETDVFYFKTKSGVFIANGFYLIN
jgi:hypothetical protein